MPYLKLETNAPLGNPQAGELAKVLSAALAQVTGKPESVCQVGVAGGTTMLMGGTNEPTAYVDVKGIGFSEEKAAPMSKAVCAILSDMLGIKGGRIYISFSSYKGSMWGVNGGTF